MPQPLLATYRLDFVYSLVGLTHHYRVYVDATSSSTDTHGFAAKCRGSQPNRDIDNCVNDVWTAIQHMYTTPKTTFDSAILEQLVSGAWNPVGAYTSVIVPAGTGTEVGAGQVTMTLRDTAFFKVRSILMESLVAAGNKTQSEAAALSPSQLWADAFSISGGSGTPTPNDWARSRGLRNLSTTPFVSQVSDYNDKIRRRRGLA